MKFGESWHKTVEMPSCFQLLGPKTAHPNWNYVVLKWIKARVVLKLKKNLNFFPIFANKSSYVLIFQLLDYSIFHLKLDKTLLAEDPLVLYQDIFLLWSSHFYTSYQFSSAVVKTYLQSSRPAMVVLQKSYLLADLC